MMPVVTKPLSAIASFAPQVTLPDVVGGTGVGLEQVLESGFAMDTDLSGGTGPSVGQDDDPTRF